MFNVCFAGVTGWTARPIIAAIDDAPDLTLTAGVSRSAAGLALADATGSGSAGSVYGSVREALNAAPVDVLVDYTSATAVKPNVWTAVQAGVHVVVGSSGGVVVIRPGYRDGHWTTAPVWIPRNAFAPMWMVVDACPASIRAAMAGPG